MQGSYLTANEVAELLKVNVDTVYGLIAKGRLPATKIGGQWRLDESEFRASLKSDRQTRVANRAEAILECAPDAMVVVDSEGTILSVNGQTEAMSGYARQEIKAFRRAKPRLIAVLNSIRG